MVFVPNHNLNNALQRVFPDKKICDFSIISQVNSPVILRVDFVVSAEDLRDITSNMTDDLKSKEVVNETESIKTKELYNAISQLRGEQK